MRPFPTLTPQASPRRLLINRENVIIFSHANASVRFIICFNPAYHETYAMTGHKINMCVHELNKCLSPRFGDLLREFIMCTRLRDRLSLCSRAYHGPHCHDVLRVLVDIAPLGMLLQENCSLLDFDDAGFWQFLYTQTAVNASP